MVLNIPATCGMYLKDVSTCRIARGASVRQKLTPYRPVLPQTESRWDPAEVPPEYQS